MLMPAFAIAAVAFASAPGRSLSSDTWRSLEVSKLFNINSFITSGVSCLISWERACVRCGPGRALRRTRRYRDDPNRSVAWLEDGPTLRPGCGTHRDAWRVEAGEARHHAADAPESGPAEHRLRAHMRGAF